MRAVRWEGPAEQVSSLPRHLQPPARNNLHRVPWLNPGAGRLRVRGRNHAAPAARSSAGSGAALARLLVCGPDFGQGVGAMSPTNLTDLEGLHVALDADPSDHLPRRLLADLCEEQGD